MPKVAVYNIEGQQVGEIELADTVFGAEVNEAAIKQVVDMQLANRRRGTASTKGRGEVRGGGRKPWRQKGTGRARHGSRRSPIWRGGAVIFGPKPRDYSFTVPKKLKRTALRSALSAKVAAGELTVLEGLEFDTPRTKRSGGDPAEFAYYRTGFGCYRAARCKGSKIGPQYSGGKISPGQQLKRL